MLPSTKALVWSNTCFEEQNAFKVVFGVQTVHIEEVIAGMHKNDLQILV